LNVLLGLLCVLICTVIQCAFIAIVRIGIHKRALPPRIAGQFFKLTALLSAVTIVLFIGMLVQVAVWAVVFVAVGEVEGFRTAAYFSMVNFTSLGYGDITLSADRAILGPMEAANGILMLGLSTSAMFAVLRDVDIAGQQR
jgi:hypothetical protein